MDSQREKLLSELLGTFKKAQLDRGRNHNIELEIKLQSISKEGFEAAYANIRADQDFGPGKLDCSVNFICRGVLDRRPGGKNDDTSYIRRVSVEQGVSSNDYYTKKSIARPVNVRDYIDWKVSVSREAPCNKFTVENKCLVRFKARVSFMLGAKWRFDLTAVKSGNFEEINPHLRMIKNQLFPPTLGLDNYIATLNENLIDSYEIEIEYMGSDIVMEDLEVVKRAFALIKPEFLDDISYREELKHVAKYLRPGRENANFRQLGNQVIAISESDYYADIYPPVGYYLTIKADGLRVLASIREGRCRLLYSNRMEEYKCATADQRTTIADCEVITTRDGAKFVYVFDVMVLMDEDISNNDFSERIKYLDDVTVHLNKFVKPNYLAKSKAYVEISQDGMARDFCGVWDAKYPYEVDGLIITRAAGSYNETRNYKWKPYTHNTIDFLAVKCPQKLLGRAPYTIIPGKTLYLLFVGISVQMREKIGVGFIQHYGSIFKDTDTYFPIQFSPSANPLAYLYYYDADINYKIVELSRDEDNAQWVFHKIREDRKMEKLYYGNDFKTAELTYSNYINKFNFEDLYERKSSYFMKTATTIYSAPNGYKRYIISRTMADNFKNNKYVIDMASGRGGDLHRYQKIGVENALFIDVDRAAITELIRRKFSFFDYKRPVRRGGQDIDYRNLFVKDSKSLTIHTLVADLKSPQESLISSIYQFGFYPGQVSGVVCNFALHYMCDTVEHLRNILLFVARSLKVGGVFMFTVMDGSRIFDLLADRAKGERWESHEHEALKYAIRKDYTSARLTNTGQQIAVLLPLSDEMYEEPLCNVDYVIQEAAKIGLKVELNINMDYMFDKFSREDSIHFSNLTDEDKKYIALHKVVTLRLVKSQKS